jgi:hypothetical protein
MRLAACAALLLLIAALPARADDPKVAIVLKDHQWVPAEVPVPAGVKVELVVRNEQPTAGEFESTVLHREKIVSAGGQVSVFIGPLSPGRYEFFDDFHGATRGVIVAK